MATSEASTVSDVMASYFGCARSVALARASFDQTEVHEVVARCQCSGNQPLVIVGKPEEFTLFLRSCYWSWKL